MPRFDRRIGSLPQFADAMAQLARPSVKSVRVENSGTYQMRTGEHLVIRTQKFEDSGLVQLPTYRRDKIGVESRLSIVGLGWVKVVPPPGALMNNGTRSIAGADIDYLYVNYRSPITVMMIDSDTYWVDQPEYMVEAYSQSTDVTNLTGSYADMLPGANLDITRYPGERLSYIATTRFFAVSGAGKEAYMQVYNVTTTTGIRASTLKINAAPFSDESVMIGRLFTSDHAEGAQNSYTIRAYESATDITANFKGLFIYRYGINRQDGNLAGSGYLP